MVLAAYDVTYSFPPVYIPPQPPQQLSTQDVEDLVSAIDANQIRALAHTVLADAAEQTGKNTEQLAPGCIDQIASAFSTPRQFVRDGIVFDFSGLLDEGIYTHTLRIRPNLSFEREEAVDGRSVATKTIAIEELERSTL